MANGFELWRTPSNIFLALQWRKAQEKACMFLCHWGVVAAGKWQCWAVWIHGSLSKLHSWLHVENVIKVNRRDEISIWDFFQSHWTCASSLSVRCCGLDRSIHHSWFLGSEEPLAVTLQHVGIFTVLSQWMERKTLLPKISTHGMGGEAEMKIPLVP